MDVFLLMMAEKPVCGVFADWRSAHTAMRIKDSRAVRLLSHDYVSHDEETWHFTYEPDHATFILATIRRLPLSGGAV